jgi:hypothetical protein
LGQGARGSRHGRKESRREAGPLPRDLAAEVERLRGRGVAFRDGIKTMGPTNFADFDDTCGNVIRLVEG